MKIVCQNDIKQNDKIASQLIKLTFEKNEKENFRTKLVIADNNEFGSSFIHKDFGFQYT